MKLKHNILKTHDLQYKQVSNNNTILYYLLKYEVQKVTETLI